MDIFETLRIEHAALSSLIDELIAKSTSPLESDDQQAEVGTYDWTDLFQELKLAFVAHDRAEEAEFYEVLRSLPHRAELAETKRHEHRLLEEMLEDIEQLNPQDREWEAKLALFKNQFEAHISEEETEVFGIMREFVHEDEREAMSSRFEGLRDDIVEGVHYHPKGRSLINPSGLDLEST